MPMCVRVSLQYLEMVLVLHLAQPWNHLWLNCSIIVWDAIDKKLRLQGRHKGDLVGFDWLDGWQYQKASDEYLSFKVLDWNFFLLFFSFFIRFNIAISKPIGTMCQVYCKWKYICHENDLLRDLCTRVLCNRDLCNRDSGCAAILGPMHSLAGALSHRPWNLVQLCTRFVQLCTKSPFCHHRQRCRI